MRTRPYENTDYSAVRHNLEQAGMYNKICDSQDNYQSMSDDHPESILVAEVGGELAGSLAITSFGVNIAVIWRMAVLENRRRQGVATRLLEAAEESITRRDFQETWAFADAGDQSLIYFYKKRGWEVFKEPNTYASLMKPAGSG